MSRRRFDVVDLDGVWGVRDRREGLFIDGRRSRAAADRVARWAEQHPDLAWGGADAQGAPARLVLACERLVAARTPAAAARAIDAVRALLPAVRRRGRA